MEQKRLSCVLIVCLILGLSFVAPSYGGGWEDCMSFCLDDCIEHKGLVAFACPFICVGKCRPASTLKDSDCQLDCVQSSCKLKSVTPKQAAKDEAMRCIGGCTAECPKKS